MPALSQSAAKENAVGGPGQRDRDTELLFVLSWSAALTSPWQSHTRAGDVIWDLLVLTQTTSETKTLPTTGSLDPFTKLWDPDGSIHQTLRPCRTWGASVRLSSGPFSEPHHSQSKWIHGKGPKKTKQLFENADLIPSQRCSFVMFNFASDQ